MEIPAYVNGMELRKINQSALDALARMSKGEANIPGVEFYQDTPESLAEKLLDGIKWDEIDCILEPSAGKGDLALYAAKKMYYARNGYPTHDDRSIRKATEEADIDCIEIDALLRNTLEGRGFRVIHDDFLSFETQKRYSLIVMNPPFDQGAEHFLKALELMEQGGEIRCILNAQTIRNPYTETRKRLVASLQTGAEISFVSGAFRNAERETDVDVALIKKVIPQRKRDSSIMQGMKEAPTYKRQEIPEQYGDLTLYSEVDEWVNRYNYEVACGIRLIEEWQAMSPNMLNLPNEKYNSPIISLKIAGCSNLDDCSINKYIRETRYKYWNMIFKQPTIVQRLTSNLINELHDSILQLVDYEFSIYNIMTLIIKMKGKGRMRIIFFHPNQDVCEFISNAVKREKTMQAACGKLEDLAQQGKVTGRDVVVTSGNSFGLMDGGVDLAVAQTWPGIEGRIQTRIAQLYGPEMPIGTALRAKVANSPNVIYVPTMQIPMEIVGTDYVYQAARAAVLTVKNELSMTADAAVFMPLMGTGAGGIRRSRGVSNDDAQ